MQKFSVIMLLTMLFLTSCGNSGSDNKTANKSEGQEILNNSESTENESTIKTLTYKKFTNNIWDFESNTDAFVYEGDEPCVIDFYATWCEPCKKVGPIMEKLAKEYEGKIVFYKVDVDDEQKLASILKIRNIPTIMFLAKDKQPQYSVGSKDEIYFKSMCDKLLK